MLSEGARCAEVNTDCHAVQFYESEDALVRTVSNFLTPAIEGGNAAIVIGRQSLRDGLAARWQAHGLQLDTIVASGRYVALDAAETLSKFMMNGTPQPKQFFDVIGGILERAASDGRQVYAFGEMVALLWSEGSGQAAIALERLWNELSREHAFSLLCAYPIQSFAGSAHRKNFEEICDCHSTVIPSESFSLLSDDKARLQEITLLQQRARSLEAEVRKRKQTEHMLRAAESELAAQVEDLVRLHDVTTHLARAADMQSSLDFVLRAVLEMENADFGLLSLASEGGSLVVGSSVGFNKRQLQRVGELLPGEGACGVCLVDRTQVFIEDTEVDPRFEQCRAFSREAGFRAVHSTPLITCDGEVIGVLSAHFPEPHRPSARQCRLADLYTSHAADLIQRRRAEDALHDSEARLRELDRRKDEFLAMLAHELRNPLSAIGNALALSERQDLGQKERAWTQEVMRRQVTQLSRLLDDLLDVSRITAGKITLKPETLLLSEVVDRAVRVAQPLLQKHKHKFFVSAVGCNPLWVDFDPARLEQVIVNLLSNAAKYTPEGGDVSLTYEQKDGDAVVRVRDTGVGISIQVLPRIFDIFVQDTRTLDRSQGGLGIGLTLVRHLVEMHGGRIFAASGGEGRGSEFSVLLPLVEPPPAKKAAEANGRATHVVPQKILIVDDNRDTALALAMLLGCEGHETKVAFGSFDALAVAREFEAETVLLDIGLPEMNGYELVRKLKELKGSSQPTFIAVSGYGQTDDRIRSSEAGFKHHLVKPVDHDELLKLISDPTAKSKV